MAIENTYLLGKNITLGCGFDLQAKAPLDSRQTVPAFEGLRALIIGDAAYEGMIVYDEGTKKTYQAQKCESYSVEVDGKPKTYDIAFREFGLTEAELKDLIAAETTAAMEFRGATAILPENPAKGDMWKVTASFEVAGETTKVGDSIVYSGTEWFRIPSGDDIEDTWRPITGVDNGSTLTFAAGEKLDVVVTAAGVVTYSHEQIAAPSLSAENVQTRTYITEVQTDGYGHIIGYKTATENVDDTNTTYEFEGLPMAADAEGNEAAPSSVYFKVTAHEKGAQPEEAAAEIVYVDTYTRNEADAKFVEKVAGKQLSTEDFTTELLAKLNGIETGANKYEHAKHTSHENGFYKVTVDAEGHVSEVVSVAKDDITDLGIPAQDTTYEKASAGADGLMSKEDFSKLAGISAGATKVENVGSGKIKIDGSEVTVYTHPETHTISEVAELQAALDAKVVSVAAGDASITIAGTATAPTVAVKISNAEGNAIELTDKGLQVLIPESTKVEASDTPGDGTIKVDGQSVTVYEHPASHTASEISDFATEVAKVKVTDAYHADAAAKVDAALTIKVGDEDVVFDGSAAKTADIDAAISAALTAALTWGTF